MKLKWQPSKWLDKKAKVGFRGYPVGTLAFYGPDNKRATKAVASVIPDAGDEPTELRRWFAEVGDLRQDAAVFTEIVTFLRDHGVRSVTMVEGIFGCPHEEGIDYPEGESCPQCPYWARRDRWATRSDAG